MIQIKIKFQRDRYRDIYIQSGEKINVSGFSFFVWEK